MLTAGKDNILKFWDVGQASVISEFWHKDFNIGTVGYMGKCRCSVCASTNERYILAGTTTGGVMVWDTKESSEKKHVQVLQTTHHKDAVVGCAWGAHNDVVSCDKAGIVVFWRDSQLD